MFQTKVQAIVTLRTLSDQRPEKGFHSISSEMEKSVEKEQRQGVPSFLVSNSVGHYGDSQEQPLPTETSSPRQTQDPEKLCAARGSVSHLRDSVQPSQTAA